MPYVEDGKDGTTPCDRGGKTEPEGAGSFSRAQSDTPPDMSSGPLGELRVPTGKQNGPEPAAGSEQREPPVKKGSWTPNPEDPTHRHWSERSWLEKLTTIPHEFYMSWLHAIGKVPFRTFDEIKARADKLLDLRDPEIKELADPVFVAVVKRAWDVVRTHQGPNSPYFGRVLYDYYHTPSETQHEPVVVEFSWKRECFEIRIMASSFEDTFFRDPTLSIKHTRRLIANSIAAIDNLVEGGNPPAKIRLFFLKRSSGRDPLFWTESTWAADGKSKHAIGMVINLLNILLEQDSSTGEKKEASGHG